MKKNNASEIEVFRNYKNEIGGFAIGAGNFIKSIIQELLSNFKKELLEELSCNYHNDLWLSPIEAADYINLSKDTVYQLTSQKKIPHCKKGKKLLFKRSELDLWIEEGRVQTIHDLDLKSEKVYNEISISK